MSKIPSSRTIPLLLRELIANHAAREVLVGGGQRYTYAELGDEVMKVSRRLFQLGVRAGDKVGILMGNRPEWVISALAITNIGGTMVAMNSWSTARELEHLISHSDSKFVIASSRFLKHDYAAMLREMEPLAERFPLLKGILTFDSDVPTGWLAVCDADHECNTVFDEKIQLAGDQVCPTDCAFLLYTSGSTSAPKGVQLIHGSLIANPWQIGERQHVVAGDRVWLAVSLFWGLGSVNALMNLLTHGGCIVLQESFDAGEALKLIEQEKCTIFYGTPNMAQAIHEHPARGQFDLSSLRGGASLGSPEQMTRVIELGASKICNIYGLTETYGNSHVTDADDDIDKRLRSCGRPLPGVEQRIVSDEGVDLPPGSIGELRIKGHVTQGYYKDEAQTLQAFDDQGYFRTGDLGYIDEEGYLFFCGRLKEMIKTGGINVSPAEVESVLMTHPGIYLAYVVGVPDDCRDEVLGAVIIRNSEVTLSEEEVIGFSKKHLAAYKVPKLVRFVNEHELPLTTTGKIQKNKIASVFFAPVIA
ncbi:AMP-binding protein [Pseudomonas aeruginosa]|uniref:class I adenylate-forming enzyme family protein n=1 Tax=Pseudomonas aeruginosa TaxID=287 RepID=UPI000E2B9361|nr:AMP-binding protein [Pseudomonas aeruginosa]MDC3991894.1 AMP-binding protein [Pseudomonas aeruginosa]RQE90761.1 AMP-dependent synthetase [Pseudomonas aeruginosa]SVK36111.1 Acyl-CoA synthetase (AMP-forming)/AMP-acid ligase II [Acinetobacter baumannii]